MENIKMTYIVKRSEYILRKKNIVNYVLLP